MSSSSPAPDPFPQGHRDRWSRAGLALLAIWAALLLVAVALWLRVALFPGREADSRGLVTVVGLPFVLVALGLLWWAWWSARALRRGRREGWLLLLVLGGVSVAQCVLTAQALLASSGAAVSTPPRQVVGGLLTVIGLGLVSVVVAVLGRRRTADDPADAADGEPDDLTGAE